MGSTNENGSNGSNDSFELGKLMAENESLKSQIQTLATEKEHAVNTANSLKKELEIYQETEKKKIIECIHGVKPDFDTNIDITILRGVYQGIKAAQEVKEKENGTKPYSMGIETEKKTEETSEDGSAKEKEHGTEDPYIASLKRMGVV